MGFTAQTFLFIFLPLSIVAYLLCTRLHRPLLNNILLVLMSLAFYVFCGLHALVVFLGLIVFVYLMGVLIGYARQAAGEKASRRWMALGAAALVALLFLCKYLTFLLDTLSALLPLELSFDGLIVPAGLSFIVFESISYLVDISRGLATPGSPLDAFVFLSLFPKVISGPIVLWRDFQPQLAQRPEPDADDAVEGLRRIIIGYSKKAILADTFGAQIARIDGVLLAGGVDTPTMWLRALLYFFQLYYDFSGYSDIAIGLCRVFGFSIKENFNFPYISTSITEFWRRWHISLGSWFRDYVYIPLGGSRCSRSRWLLNVFLVWGLTGLWHGAAWNFVLWGLFFAVLLAAEKLWYGHRLEKTRLLKHLYMLPLLAVSFVLFHAADLPAAGQQIAALFGFGGLPASGVESLYYLRSYAVVLVIALLGATPLPAKAVQRLRNTSAGSAVLSVAEPVALVLLLAACTAYLVDGSFNPFLYFRF